MVCGVERDARNDTCDERSGMRLRFEVSLSKGSLFTWLDRVVPSCLVLLFSTLYRVRQEGERRRRRRSSSENT